MEIGKKYYLDLGSLAPVEVEITNIDEKYVYVNYLYSWAGRMERFKIDEFKWIIGEEEESEI